MKESKEKKNKRPERGIETMIRIVSSGHQRLSDMADNKAHIMITVNSIILSVVIGVLLRKIEEFSNLALPSLMLLTVNVVTIIFSALATRPSVPRPQAIERDRKSKKFNLLFFGNFVQMNAQEYIDSMSTLMEDNTQLYRSILFDIYCQGVVLSKKYKLLRIAYNTFMFGIVSSVLAFIISILITGELT